MAKFRKVFIVLVVSFLYFGFNPTVKAAESYLGDFCWRIDVLTPFTTSWTYKLGVYMKDGGHIALYGTEDDVYPWHGNAEIVGSNVIMTLIGTGNDGSLFSEFINATIDINSLTGTFAGHGIQNSSNPPVTDYFSGNMTFITCP